MKQTKQFLRPLLMAIVMMVGMLMPQGAWAEELRVDGKTVTISSDASYERITVDRGGILTINEGVTVEVELSLAIESGTVINYGAISGIVEVNEGTFANHGSVTSVNNWDGTFYNTGTYDELMEGSVTPCSHTQKNSTGVQVPATCTHGAGTQYRCKQCHYIGVNAVGDPLPHDNHDHNGLIVCSMCGQLTFDAPTVGEGTAESPYQIANAGHLFWLADKVNNDYNNFKDANAVLTADIVVNDGTFAADGTFTATGASEPSTPIEWLIIGRFNEYPYGYGGTFDGQGHTISGLYANYSYSGLVGCSARECKIKNVGVINSYFDGTGVGGICGFADCNIEISNCYSSNVICKGGYVGGILGQSYFPDVSIINCYSTASLIGYEDQVGGIAGQLSGSTTNCYTSYGNVNGWCETEINCEANVTPERFASGEIAYKLNGSTSEGTQAWYQAIGTDAAPVLVSNGSNTVYEVDLLTCSGENAGKTFANANDAVTQPHDYHVLLDENSNPVFVWSEDYTTATLQVVCSRDEEHTAGVEVTLGEGITWVDTPATCTAVGVRTYTATATYEGKTYTGTAIVATDPIAEHTLDEHNVCTGCGHGFIFFEKERSYDIEPNNRYAFSNSEGSVEYIGNTTFNEWMCAFEFSGLVTEIGDRAFTSREALTAIYLPEVTTIGEDAFKGCGLRDNVSLPKATTIGQAAFLGCGFQTLSLPEATTIGYGAFWSCDNLSSIELPKATTIENDAFRECSNLNSITVACAADLSGAKIREGATITRVHDFSSKTLTAEPVADGLYAYVCDRGCGAHSDDHVVKGDSDGNTIELTANTVGETTTYTAADVTIEDGKAFSTPVAFTAPSDQVTVERTFTASKPATVMLPFSIDASLVQGATFSEFSGVSYDAGKAQWVATMTSVTTGNLQAYKPYIVILDADNVTGEVTFGNNSVDVATFVATPEASTMKTSDENGWTFKAVNAAKTWSTNDPEIGKAYGFAGQDKTVGGNDIHRGDFVKIAAGASAKPGRCYLMKEGALTRATEELPASIKVRFISGSATGIGTLDTETGEMTLEGWYDLNGNKIEQPSKSGVYINNNKKVMVK